MVSFTEWEPVYEAILDSFGYDREGDERARDLLATLLTGQPCSLASLEEHFQDATVALAAPTPTLREELSTLEEADVVVAISGATATLRSAGVPIDLAVSDLDKEPETLAELTDEGTPVAVHAHGDNVEELREWVPQFDSTAVLPTTQAEPTEVVVNVGGFTDGDRGAFLADALGADCLTFAGWDLTDRSVGPEKRQKLQWASRLLYWLEHRREERFAVLDGQRAALDLPPGAPVQ